MKISNGNERKKKYEEYLTLNVHKPFTHYKSIEFMVASINDTNLVEAFEYFSDPANDKIRFFLRLCNEFPVFKPKEIIDKLGPEFVYERFKNIGVMYEDWIVALQPYVKANLSFEFLPCKKTIPVRRFDKLVDDFGYNDTVEYVSQSLCTAVEHSKYSTYLLEKAKGVDRRIVRMMPSYRDDIIPLWWQEYIKKDLYTSFDELSQASPHNLAVLLAHYKLFSIKNLAQHFGTDYVIDRIPVEIALRQDISKQVLSLDGVTFKQSFKFYPDENVRLPKFWEDFIQLHNTEFFEYFAKEKPKMLKNILVNSTAFNPKIVVSDLGAEKTIDLIPKLAFNRLPKEWAENIFADKNFNETTLQRMIDNMGYEIFNLSNSFVEQISKNDKYKDILTYSVLRKFVYGDANKNEKVTKASINKILQEICQNTEVFDQLPGYIARIPEVQTAFGRHRQTQSIENPKLDKLTEEIDDDWLDKDGKLVQFFKLYSDFPIKTKADYIKVYEAYKQSKMSAEQFCNTYKITPSSGFQLMLDAISLENHDEHVAITEGKYDIQRRFVGSFVTNAHKVANGTMTMEEFFNVPTAYSYNMSMFDSLLADKPEIRNAFVKSMIDYFATMDPKAISEKEITFIGGNPKDLSDTFFNKLKPELIFPQDRDYVRKLQFARNHIRLCEKGYSRLLIRGTSYIVDGKSHPVTDQVIDQALAYADDNGIFRCNYTISQLSKDIATGKLDYSAQTEGLMSEMRDVLKDLLQEKTQIEEYLQVMKDGHEM